MRLIACPTCHTQYDVTRIVAEHFACRCGAEVRNQALQAVDAPTHRCGGCGALVQDGPSCEYCGAALAVDPGKLSLICPECFARNVDESRFCTACGVAFRPEPVLAEGHELPCPVCEVLMPPRQLVGLAINECPRCNGLWVPEQHFDVLVHRAIEARRGADSERPPPEPRVTGSNPAAQALQYRKCPECDAYMHRRNFRKSSGVILDVCHEHGTWLDADELEQIAGFILSGGETSPLLAAEEPRRSPEQRRAEVDFARILARNPRIEGVGGELRAGSLLDVLTRLLS